MSELAGKKAWVIGGGSGLGAAAAVDLAAKGADVVVSGRRVDALENTRQRILDAGGKADILPLDVEDAAAIERAAETIGVVDILVYTSGTNVTRRSFAEVSKAGWNSVVNVNLNGAFNAVHSVLPGMRAKRDGVIVLISSWAGWRLEPVAGAAYSATKRAMMALNEVINVEEGPSGIRSSCICPAEVDTEVLNTRPVPPTAEARAKMLHADDVGRLIGFIAASPSRMCFNEIVVSPVVNNFYRPKA